MANGAAIVEAIVITGTYDNWPGGPRTLTRRRPAPRPRPTTLQFGAQVEPDGLLVWFRVDDDEMQLLLENTQEDTPEVRGARLVSALIAWLSEGAEHRLEDCNTFQVFVSDAGDTTVEPVGD